MRDALPDAVLLAAVDTARDALLEITPAATVGEPVGHIVEDTHVLSIQFACTLPGYPGWHWTVTMSRVDDESAPSVLETELMPGERALLAPDWIPWSERLAEYQASQEALRLAGIESDGGVDPELEVDDLDDDLDGEDPDDEDDLDDDDPDDEDNLHDADIDGVDIDLEDESSAASDGEIDETDDPEDDPGDSGPQPPGASGRDEGAVEDEHEHQGDHPRD